jgi:DNA-binding HxlR family transcriptional regulator
MEKELLNQTLQDLIAKGLVAEIIVNGEVKYKLTPLGRAIGKHMESMVPVKN